MAKPEWMPQRLYQWTKPRSLGLHALFILIAGGCLVAGWWQIHRAMAGNGLSYLYSVEWPVIAIVVGIGWWQLFHDTPEDIARRNEYHRRMRAASAEVVARTLPRSARALTVGSEEVSGRAVGAAARTALTATTTTTGTPRSGLSDPGAGPTTGIASPASSAAQLVPAGRPPVTVGTDPGDLAVRVLADEGDPDGPIDEATAYNRYLATLAVKGRAKTWRHPHGL
jgi:hypothetical protein